MKPGTRKNIRGEQKTDWVKLIVILCGIIFGSSFVIGPILSGIDSVSKKIVLTYQCPGATDIIEKRGPIVQVGSDPNSFGQTVQGICVFADGDTKIVSNDEYAVTTIIGSLGLGAILGMGIAIIFTPIYIVWRKKTIR